MEPTNGLSEAIHAILGCRYGWVFYLKDAPEPPCPSRAVRIMAIHIAGDEECIDVKLCQRHHDLLEAATTPHRSTD